MHDSYHVKDHVVKNAYLVMQGERVVAECETLDEANELIASFARAMSHVEPHNARKHEWAFRHGNLK